MPSNPEDFTTWMKAAQHLEFLKTNASDKELVIYGLGPFSFIHSIVVPNEDLREIDKEDLLRWSCDPYTTIAGYVSGGDPEKIWIERGNRHRGAKCLSHGTNLVFSRTFHG